MAKEKIYLVQVHADWHNCDTEIINKAYKDRIEAHHALKKEYKKIKNYCINRLHREIVEEWDIEIGSSSFVTSADDYIDVWIDVVWLNR